MKKLLTLLTLVFAFAMCQKAYCADTNWDSAASLTKVNTIGKKLLADNKLPTQITFKVSDQEDINAYANIDKEIYVFKGLLKYVSNDEELASVIAHEIAHIANSHCSKQTMINVLSSAAKSNVTNQNLSLALDTTQQLSMLKISREDEYEADLTGIDLMIGAKYNPQAMISFLNKICGNYFDVLETHPSGEKRIMNIYDYLSYNYPDNIKTAYSTDSYKQALTYIEPVVKERTSNSKKMKDYQKKQEKLKQKRIKRAEKIRKTSNPWDTSYTMLKVLTGN